MNSIFAREAAEALTTTTSFQQFLMKKGKKLYLGDEQREGWSGPIPLYLFLCEACGQHAKDYPHGFIRQQYLSCSHCGERHDFVPLWAKLTMLFQE